VSINVYFIDLKVITYTPPYVLTLPEAKLSKHTHVFRLLCLFVWMSPPSSH